MVNNNDKKWEQFYEEAGKSDQNAAPEPAPAEKKAKAKPAKSADQKKNTADSVKKAANDVKEVARAAVYKTGEAIDKGLKAIKSACSNGTEKAKAFIEQQKKKLAQRKDAAAEKLNSEAENQPDASTELKADDTAVFSETKPIAKADGKTAKITPITKADLKSQPEKPVTDEPAPEPAPIEQDKPAEKRRKKAAVDKDDIPVRFRRDRHSGIIGGILYFVLVVGVSVLLASFMWMAATDVLAFGKPEEMVEVRIPEGFDTETVTNELFNRGLIKYRWLFKFYSGLSSTPIEQKIDPGTYKLYTNYDYRALMTGMTESAGEKVYLNVTIPEGYTEREIFNLLEQKGVSTAEKLWNTATNYDYDYEFLDKSSLGERKRLEGFLFPDTYEFYLDQPPESVIKKFLDNFDNRLTSKFRSDIEESGYSVRDIIIIASLIEKEAAGDADRGAISSVIYNRLNTEWFAPFLNFDSTIWYIVRETGEEFSTEIDSPYNTYMYTGLPAGPIANPGLAAIKAAIYPDDTDYFYYALDIYGEHQFFTNQDSFIWFTNSDEFAG